MAWVEDTLRLGNDGNGEMTVADSQMIDENMDGLRGAWGIERRGEIDGTLDTDGRHWDEVLETSLFGVEQCLDTYNNGTFVNGDIAVYEGLYHHFLPSLMPPEDSNSEIAFRQGRYEGVVHDEELTSPTYIDADISSNIPGMTTCISSFSG